MVGVGGGMGRQEQGCTHPPARSSPNHRPTTLRPLNQYPRHRRGCVPARLQHQVSAGGGGRVPVRPPAQALSQPPHCPRAEPAHCPPTPPPHPAPPYLSPRYQPGIITADATLHFGDSPRPPVGSAAGDTLAHGASNLPGGGASFDLVSPALVVDATAGGGTGFPLCGAACAAAKSGVGAAFAG